MGNPVNLPSVATISVTVNTSGQLTGIGTNLFSINSGLLINAGFITSGQTGSFGSGGTGSVNTGTLTGAFYPLNTNPNSYITPSQTGAFVSTGQTGSFANSTNTGQLTGVFILVTPPYSGVTGFTSGIVGIGLGSNILNNKSYFNGGGFGQYNFSGLLTGQLYYYHVGDFSNGDFGLFDNQGNTILSSDGTFVYTGNFYQLFHSSNLTGKIADSIYPVPYHYYGLHVGQLSGDGTNIINIQDTSLSSNVQLKSQALNTNANGGAENKIHSSNTSNGSTLSLYRLNGGSGYSDINFFTSPNSSEGSATLQFAVGVSSATGNFPYGQPYVESYLGSSNIYYVGAGQIYGGLEATGAGASHDFVWYNSNVSSYSNKNAQNELLRILATKQFISGYSLFIQNSITGNNVISVGKMTASGFQVLTTADIVNFTGSSGTGTINTGALTGAFYPLNSNPSSFVTASQTGVFLAKGNNLSDVSSFTGAASNVGIYPLSPPGGNSADTDQTGVAPKYVSQLSTAWYGNKVFSIYAGGSTAVGDWNHALAFPGGIASIGDSSKTDPNLVDLYVNLNGSPTRWSGAGDSLIRVYNWSSSSGNSGGGFGIVVMSGVGFTGQASVYDPVGCSFNHVPANRVSSLIPGNAMLVFNQNKNHMRGLAICGPGLAGYDNGNYSLLYADLTGGKLRVPYWVPGAYQPTDSGWLDCLLINPLNGNTTFSGGAFNILSPMTFGVGSAFGIDSNGNTTTWANNVGTSNWGRVVIQTDTSGSNPGVTVGVRGGGHGFSAARTGTDLSVVNAGAVVAAWDDGGAGFGGGYGNYHQAPSWNNSPTKFTAHKINIIDIASQGNSLLFDGQLNNSSVFQITKSGSVTVTGTLTVSGKITSSGFQVLTTADSVNFTGGGGTGSVNTGALTGAFYPLNSNPSSYVTASQTGAFITTGQTGSFGSSATQSGSYIFNTTATSGVTQQFISFPASLGSNPFVISSLNNISGLEDISVQTSGITSSGYWAHYSNTIDSNNYILTTLASISTQTGLATTVIVTSNTYITTGIPITSSPTTWSGLHGLSSAPSSVEAYMLCVASDSNLGYVSGDMVPAAFFLNTTNPNPNVAVYANATIVGVSWQTSTAAGWNAVTKAGGNFATITSLSNWKLKIKATQ